MLVMGSYDSKIAFWEPMFPYSFVSGDTSWVTVRMLSTFGIKFFQILVLKYALVVAIDLIMFYSLFRVSLWSNFYEESVTYVQQTISLPEYYSVSYDSTTAFTTETIKGKAVDCVPGGASKAGKIFN
jgi:hypothetical protein